MAPLTSFLKIIKEPLAERRTVWNFLDIPIASATTASVPMLYVSTMSYERVDITQLGSHLFDTMHLEYALPRNPRFETQWPTSSLSWALVASAGATSEPHIDAGGFCTFVQVQFGQKIWYMAADLSSESSAGRPQILPLDEDSNINVGKFEWTRVVLNEGDVLYVLAEQLLRPRQLTARHAG